MALVQQPVLPAPGPCGPAVCPLKSGGREAWAELHAPLARDRYAVSTHGRVRNLSSGRLLTLQEHATGYTVVNLGKAYRMQLVHRLVALAFLGPPRHGLEVDHLDFGRRNNRVTNLRWLPKVHNAWRWKRAEREVEVQVGDPGLAAEMARYDAMAAAAPPREPW